MRKNSLFRALRVDKLIYAALEGTLLAYVKRDYEAIPILRMMRLSKGDIGRRAEIIAEKLVFGGSKWSVDVIDGESVIGGGAAPSSVLPTRVLAIESARFQRRRNICPLAQLGSAHHRPGRRRSRAPRPAHGLSGSGSDPGRSPAAHRLARLQNRICIGNPLHHWTLDAHFGRIGRRASSSHD